MISIVRKKFGLPINDVFFAGDTRREGAESPIQFFIQAAHPAPGFYPFKTQIIELNKAPAELFAHLSSNTRYKIRRAEREGVVPTVSPHPTSAELDTFCSFYDTFAAQKQRGASNRPKLQALTEKNALILATATDQSGATIAAHAYVADSQILRTRLLYSASHFRGADDSEARNQIGRANRFLHWHEIEQFKQLGYESYDLGGIPLDESDPEKNAIARFKSEFGGHHIIEYNGYQSSLPLVRHAISFARGILS
jgi:lipid II:glycine glycyltransferase (peptidoglycan interpeptide bridge formation enzyme)